MANGNPNSRLDEARRLIEALVTFPNGDRSLSSALPAEALAHALAVPATHKSHPIAHLVRSVQTTQFGSASQVRVNLNRAIGVTGSDPSGEAHRWAVCRLEAACFEDAIETASSMVAEIRAFGSLWETGFTARPVPPSDSRTPDFRVELGADSFAVEVHCRQMNGDQARRLREFHERQRSRTEPGSAEHVIHPMGAPRAGETTTENVISKFAQIKARALQASKESPTCLWLDLQDEDTWVVNASGASPVGVWRGELFSGGLWQAVYGVKGTPFFEGHALERRAVRTVPRMRHPGLFAQSPEWTAVILSFPRDTIVFENPCPRQPLTAGVRAAFLSLPWFNLEQSFFAWPAGVRSVSERIADQHQVLEAIASLRPNRW